VRAALLGVAIALAGVEASAQCSGGSACPPCRSCRIAPASGANPSVTEMSALFDRIAAGPMAYGSLGWDFGGRNTVGSGGGWCSGSGRRDTVPVTFPCVLLKAIYLTESSWRQFCSTNETVISFDCGYGIAQVTSGMRRGETSAYDADRVASSAAYNVSVGAAILTDKWRASPCIGDNDPQVVEDWYFATWGYNGFVTRNNPNNPMFAADRREFRTPGLASAQVRGNYPYQELVWGYAHYPLTAAHYTGVALAYPARGEICASCGRPTDSISRPAGSHRGTCPTAAPMDAGSPVDVPVVRDDGARPDDGVALDDGARPDVGVASDVGARDVPAMTTDRPADAGLDGGRDAGATPDVDDTLRAADEGCGCGVAGSRRGGGLWIAGLLALATASSWRRARPPGPRSAARRSRG
jgi:hypothetical protein